MYNFSRVQQLIIYEKPTGKKDGSKILTTILWPSGFSILPTADNLGDEEFMTLKYYAGFLAGEKEACIQIMNRKQGGEMYGMGDDGDS